MLVLLCVVFLPASMYITDYSVRRYETDVMQHAPGGPAVPGAGVKVWGGSSKEPERVRVEFPETWLWFDSVTGYYSAILFFVPCLPVLCYSHAVFLFPMFCFHFFACFVHAVH